MSENKRIGRNVGRIELLAAQDKIKPLLESGYDRKKIHSRLLEEGVITMSYPTFCYQLKRLLTAVPPGPSSQLQRTKASALFRPDRSEPFSINKNPKIEDLV